jgi:hypothetical protein
LLVCPLLELGGLGGWLSGSRVASGTAEEDSPGDAGGVGFVAGAAFPAPDAGAQLSSASLSSSGGSVVPGGGSGLCARAPESPGVDAGVRSESADDESESESPAGGATLLDSPVPLPALGAETAGEFGSLGGRCEGSCSARTDGEPAKNNALVKNTSSGIRVRLRR